MGTNKEHFSEDDKLKKNIQKVLSIMERVEKLKNKVKVKEPKRSSRSLMILRKINQILLQADHDWGMKLTMTLLAERLAKADNHDGLDLLLKGCRNTFPKRKVSNTVDRLIAYGSKQVALGPTSPDGTMSNPRK